MSSGGQNAGRDEAAFRLNFSASQAEFMMDKGNSSGKKRGVSYEPSSMRLPNPREEEQLTQSTAAANERRKHVTETIADHYRESRG
ncbi:hypothetical protein ABZX51_007882 [Aspergillus tubingensis]